MSDVNALIVQPLKEFYKDSKLLVQKCTKPDAKGSFVSFQIFIVATTMGLDVCLSCF